MDETKTKIDWSNLGSFEYKNGLGAIAHRIIHSVDWNDGSRGCLYDDEGYITDEKGVRYGVNPTVRNIPEPKVVPWSLETIPKPLPCVMGKRKSQRDIYQIFRADSHNVWLSGGAMLSYLELLAGYDHITPAGAEPAGTRET